MKRLMDPQPPASRDEIMAMIRRCAYAKVSNRTSEIPASGHRRAAYIHASQASALERDGLITIDQYGIIKIKDTPNEA
jgi:hypothetical protein